MTDENGKNSSYSNEEEPFFSASPGNANSSYDSLSQESGGEIGPYKLLSILGEGGYGVVYLAEQQKPVRRQVALKIIKPGMDTKQVIARFEAERQALALLDHPNIASVYDAGTTLNGRPYFVMELVKGMPINEHCDWQNLNIEERLKLFLQVCDAIHHAHQKGIIHRDIKPSNILVSIMGKRTVPKVIDFGVAKAVNRSLTERTLYTEQGQFIGTPEYMSPEQAEMTGKNIDVRSDIYSLGVVLYELLIGALPFDAITLREAGIDRLRQIIREQEPKTPSTRLSRLGVKAEQIAAKRRTEVRALAKRLHKELEWIPMKAMRKERTHRYQSVSELSEDIQNYLSGAPLLAGPESVTYRIEKFVRRHKRVAIAVTAAIMAVIIGLVVSTTMYIRAEKQRQIAVKAQIAESKQKEVADEERDRAVKAERQAEKRLVDLYEQQARRYMEGGSLDEALLVLNEAYKIDNQRLSLRFLLAESMRKHKNPAFHRDQGLLAWEGSESDINNSAFAVSPAREFIAFFDESQDFINIYDTKTAKLKVQLPCKAVIQLAFTPGSRHIIIKAAEDNTHHILKIFDVQKGKEIYSIKRSNVDIDKLYESVDYPLPDREQLTKVYNSICMDPDGNWFVFIDVIDSGGELKPEICLWDFKSYELHRSQNEYFSSLITFLIFRSESIYGFNTVLCTLDCNDLCQCWEIPTLKPGDQFFWPCQSAVIGPKHIVSVNNSTALLLDRKTNRHIRNFPNVIWAGFSPNYRQLITKQAGMPSTEAGSTSTAEYSFANLWNTDDGRHIVELAGKDLQNWHFTPDSNCLITEYADGQIKVWSVDDGRLMFLIASELEQKETDISPDSCWLVTCSNQLPGTIKIWNLVTGDLFEPYQDEVLVGDIAEEWLQIDYDRIFSFSHHPPERLARFNADGMCLITKSSLRDIMSCIPSPEYVGNTIEAHISLRLENGRIRSALPKEMLRAKLEYFVMIKGEQDPETIALILDLAVNEIEAGQLEEASEVLKGLQSLPPRENADLIRQEQKVIEQLSRAYCDRADRGYRSCKYAAAIADYESALSLDADNPLLLNNFAILQATCPDIHFRDKQAAVENAKKACVLTDWKQWDYLSTCAVACAGDGKFADAMKYQKKAMDLLPLDRQDKWLANFEQRLKLFQSNKPYNRKSFWNLPVQSMIAWWNFDQTQGSNVFDSSGNGLNGKLEGTACIITDTDRGDVLSNAGEGGYVDCGNHSSYNMSGPMTISAWIKTNVFDKQWHAIVTKGDAAWELEMNSNIDTLRFSCDGLLETLKSNIEGTIHVNNGKWHHVVAKYDGAMLALYVDGVLDDSKSAKGEINNQTYPVCIGANAWGEKNRIWNGRIDDVRIYNRALSEEEIVEFYNETK